MAFSDQTKAQSPEKKFLGGRPPPPPPSKSLDDRVPVISRCGSGTALKGVANGTSKNVGLRKFCQDLEISEAFMIEVSFFHGLFLLF